MTIGQDILSVYLFMMYKWLDYFADMVFYSKSFVITSRMESLVSSIFQTSKREPNLKKYIGVPITI